MSQRLDFCEKAVSQVGVKESPANSNKTIYGAFTGHNGQPWCGSFVMWCANEVGLKIPNCVYTPAGVAGFQGKGLWANAASSTPKPGWIAFFDFPGNEKTDHVGIVVSVNNDGTLTTIEGNTIPDGSKSKKSEANGGEVCMKTRAYKANKKGLPIFISGFGKPQFKD